MRREGGGGLGKGRKGEGGETPRAKFLATALHVLRQIAKRLQDGMKYQLLYEYNRTAQNDNKTSPETLQLTHAWDHLQTQVTFSHSPGVCLTKSKHLTSPLYLFSARQHAERAICYRPSVRLSVRLSVTRVDQSKTV